MDLIRRLGAGSAEIPKKRVGVREPIAITGIGCRYPGAVRDAASFWELLRNGVDAITEVPAERWNVTNFYDATPGRSGKSISRWGGYIDGFDQFDAGFFGISPREAECMDPQHRLLLMTAWEAMDDAGVRLEHEMAAGVFIGICTNDYAQIQTSPTDYTSLNPWTATGGVASLAANRISYCLNLRGPSLSVDTACSSSLVALHLACRSLEDGECLVAVVGGVNALFIPSPFISFSRSGMLSPDGRCKAFDARANGFVRAEGVGVLVLKPLSAAIADGSAIYAVIRGTAVNQDGRTDGISVPNTDAQEAVVREACLRAGVQPRDIQYIEAHGTGTAVGDPIEAAALGATIGSARRTVTPCVIGSVKTNIGHLEAGAGIAGVIKAALALHHRQIPPTLHFETPNPHISFERCNLRVATDLEPFDTANGLPLAGVNSFGFGGTNAHAILQAPPIQGQSGAASVKQRELSRPNLLTLSARSLAALRDLAARYRDYLGESEEPGLADICFTAGAHRTPHPHRLAVAATDREEFAAKLVAFVAGEKRSGVSDGQAPSESAAPVFVFSGQGPQWWAMGRELLAEEPVFRAKIEECDRLIRKLARWSLLEELSRDEATSRMHDTAIAQPAIFSLQLALVALWESWGVRPAAVVGHSVGEAAAACVSGVLSLRDAMHVIVQRGRCMALAPQGRMLAVGLAWHEIDPWLKEGGGSVEIGSFNGPRSVVLSGDCSALERIEARLLGEGIICRRLQVNYAFHSCLMDPIRSNLVGALGRFRTHAATVPVFSTVSGAEIGEDDFGSDYWWKNVRQPVRFASAFETLLRRGHRVFVEVGPHPVLAASMLESLTTAGLTGTILPSLRRKEPERLTLLGSLGTLQVLGNEVDWKALYPTGKVVHLPGYPWQLRRFWYESEAWTTARFARVDHPLLTERLQTAAPTWQTRLDFAGLPYLLDHRVHGRIIFPATAYVEMALAAAVALKKDRPLVIEEIDFQSALFLSEDETPLVLQLAMDAQQSSFTISARRDGDTWTSHAAGQLGAALPAREPATSLDLLRARCKKPVSGDRTRAMIGEAGLRFGPAFSGLEIAYQGSGEALGRVVLPPQVETKGYEIHPALLDACFQVLAHAILEELGDRRPLYLPVYIDQVRFFASPTGAVWSHAQLVQHGEKVIVGNVQVFDEQGTLLVDLRGLRFQTASATSAVKSEDDWCYELQWQLKPLRGDSRPQGNRASWLIFADRTGLGEALAARLRGRGDRAVTVFAEAHHGRCGDDCFEMRAESREDLETLIVNIHSGEFAPIAGVVHLWNLNAPASADATSVGLSTAQAQGCCSLLPLLQVLLNGFAEALPRLWLVTRGAQSVVATDIVSLAQTPVWGAGRVVLNEIPKLTCRMVDLGGEGVGADVLLDEMDRGDDEEEVAYRHGDRYVNRLTKTSFTERFIRSHGPQEVMSYRLELGGTIGIDQLTVTGTARRSPGPEEVEIEVRASGLNFRDVLKALGIYPTENVQDNLLGDECAGQIVAVGKNVHGFEVGDEVIAMTSGCFGSHVTVAVAIVARKPARLSFEEAATLPVAFVTAWYALHHLGRIRAGERVLIHAAAGGVGLAAVQIAQLAGAEVFATAGSDEKRNFLRALGIAHVMDSRSLAFADEVRILTGGEGVDIVLNSLSGEAIPKGISCLRPRGRFLEIGKRDVFQNAKLGLRPFRNNISFFAIDLAQVLEDDPAFVRSLLQKVSELINEQQLRPLPVRGFGIRDHVDAFRHMAQARHVGKIALSLQPGCLMTVPRSETPIRFRQDGSYLVTGGLSGFGLAVARWMSGNGAGTLVLVSRSGAASETGRRAVAEVRELGARVIALAADVAREEDMNRLFTMIDRDLPPLCGVIHSAMVMDDGTVMQQTGERFRKVMDPKVAGAWNLHRRTSDRPLDFFVLFSSLSSILGNAGQISYAAANAFLDGLAHYRRGCGLPAAVVNWGIINEVGFMARNAKIDEAVRSHGVGGFAPTEATAILGRVIQSSATQVGAFRVEWPKLATFLPSVATSARYAALVSIADARLHDAPSGLEAILTLPEGERLSAVTAEVSKQLSHVLRIRTEELDPSRPLGELGLDSLMTVELMNRLEGSYRISLPPGTVSSNRSASSIAAALLKRFVSHPGQPFHTDAQPNGGVAITECGSAQPSEPAPSVATTLRVVTGSGMSGEGWSGRLLHARFRLEWMALRVMLAYFRAGEFQRAQRHLRVISRVLPSILRHDWHWALQNLRLVFGPNLTESARVRLATLAFEHHLSSFLEGLRHEDVAVEFRNHERILSAHEAGRGVILCGIHLGSWESALHEGPLAGLPVVGVYRRALNPFSDRVFQQIRARYRIDWIASDDADGILRALRARKIIALMTDLNTPLGGVTADFLGVPAMCPPGPARLALMSGAPVLPVVAIRTGSGKVMVQFEPDILAERSNDQEADVRGLTERINRAFEPWILDHAEQYNWLHPRWRNRPDGTRWPNGVSEAVLYEARNAPFLTLPERVKRLIGI